MRYLIYPQWPQGAYISLSLLALDRSSELQREIKI
nr:MAG TPA: hypothetical protein [Caudoviricetes sp.]